MANGTRWKGAGKGAVAGAAMGTTFGPWGTAIGAGLGALYGGTIGADQEIQGEEQLAKGRKQAEELAKNVPQYAQDAQSKAMMEQQKNLYASMAAEGLPAAQKQEYLNNLERSTSYALGQLESRKGGLAGVGTMQQTNVDAYNKLLSQDAAARQQNLRAYGGLLGQQAGIYKGIGDTAFEYNKWTPYTRDYAQAQGLIGAGLQNQNIGAQNQNQLMMMGLSSMAGAKGLGYNSRFGDGQYSQGQQNAPYVEPWK